MDSLPIAKAVAESVGKHPEEPLVHPGRAARTGARVPHECHRAAADRRRVAHRLEAGRSHVHDAPPVLEGAPATQQASKGPLRPSLACTLCGRL